MNKITTIVWDWNGTLLNDVDLCLHTINRLLGKRELPLLDHDSYQRVFQFPIIDYYRKAGFDFDKEPFETLAHEYMSYYQPHSLSCPLHVHAKEMLEHFRAQGKHQVLLSASRLDLLQEQLTHYPLTGCFEEILGISDLYAHSKADLAKRYVSESGKKPQEIVFIGDSVHDYEVASNAGCRCILVANGHEHKEKLLRCGCETVNKIEELRSILG